MRVKYYFSHKVHWVQINLVTRTTINQTGNKLLLSNWSHSGKQNLWYLPEEEPVWTWDMGVCVSLSWLLHGLSQLDRRREWRPRPRSVTSDELLDEGTSWEPGMTPQLGKSILLLPTAARSDSSGSKIELKDVAKRQEKRVSKKSCQWVSQRKWQDKKSADTFFEDPCENKHSPRRLVSPTLADGGANLLPRCLTQLPCISVRITDPPSSMWHSCWCTRTPLLMTSASSPPPCRLV